jgi:hypothetical protein
VGSDFEGSYGRIIEVLFRHLPGEIEEYHKKSYRIAKPGLD